MNPRNPFLDNAPRWRQCLLKLTRIVIIETRRRLVLIPDRMSAENERDKLRREHGPAMIAAKITKIGTGKAGTYTLAYTLRDLPRLVHHHDRASGQFVLQQKIRNR